jgi:Fur family ferric uptake transcriptional regulator
MTPQRRVILEELKKVTSHPTADEIYEMVRRRLPHISLGTVYRNLEILSQCGMIQKLEPGGTQKHFDGMAENHYHFRCLGCGCIEDVSLGLLHDLEASVPELDKYEIIGHRLELIGYCPDCKKGRKPS